MYVFFFFCRIKETESLLRPSPRSSGLISLHLLITIFGISAWLGVNSILAELPVIIQNAPEGWNLPSQMMIFLQLGNFTLMLLMEITQKFKLRHSIMIAILLVIGISGALMTAMFSNTTIVVFGQERSVIIFGAVFIFALIGYSSLAFFIPFVGKFKECYLISYFLGESMSSLFPGILTFVQGIDGKCDKNNSNLKEATSLVSSSSFGIETFFVGISIIFSISLAAFVIISVKRSYIKELAPLIKIVTKTVDYNNNEKLSSRTLSTNDKFMLFAILSVSFSLYSGILPR